MKTNHFLLSVGIFGSLSLKAQLSELPNKIALGPDIFPNSALSINKPTVGELIRVNSTNPQYLLYSTASGLTPNGSFYCTTLGFNLENRANPYLRFQNGSLTLEQQISTSVPVSLEQGLHVKSAITTNNSQGSYGKPLTSRGNFASPTWDNTLIENPEVGFSVRKDTDIMLNALSENAFNDFVSIYNDSTNVLTGFNVSSGQYQIPNNGYYHFEVNVPRFNFPINSKGSLVIQLHNSTGDELTRATCRFGSSASNSSTSSGCRLSTNLRLTENEVVYFKILNFSVFNISIPNSGLTPDNRIRFSGFKIY